MLGFFCHAAAARADAGEAELTVAGATLADVDIRGRTQLRFGLQDAPRAVLRESGGLSRDWPIERVLRTVASRASPRSAPRVRVSGVAAAQQEQRHGRPPPAQ